MRATRRTSARTEPPAAAGELAKTAGPGEFPPGPGARPKDSQAKPGPGARRPAGAPARVS